MANTVNGKPIAGDIEKVGPGPKGATNPAAQPQPKPQPDPSVKPEIKTKRKAARKGDA